MTRRILMVSALALGLGVLPLMAQGAGQGRGRGFGPGPGGPDGGGRGRGGPGVMGMVHRLDLTDAQKDQLRALMEEGRQGDERGQAVRAAEQKLHAAVFGETPNPAAIEAARTALATAHAAELDRRIEQMQKVAQILTPAQRQQLARLQPQGPPRRH